VEVGGTKILVGFLEDGRQVVVYRNYVSAEFDTSRSGGRKNAEDLANAQAALAKKDEKTPTPAMILPFPFEEGRAPVEFFALDPKETFFADLKACFPVLKENEEKKAKSRSLANEKGKLAVQQVGSYNVSVASSIEDLGRANPAVFQLSTQAGELLGRHYGKGFGFVIAGLREGGEKHPLAYAHAPWQKGTRLFVPTKHFHGADSQAEDKKPAYFDHEIYSLGAARAEAGPSTQELEADLGERAKESNGASYVARGKDPHGALAKLPFKVRFGPLRLLEKKGNFENEDVILTCAGN
jgi:hypothetical protein